MKVDWGTLERAEGRCDVCVNICCMRAYVCANQSALRKYMYKLHQSNRVLLKCTKAVECGWQLNACTYSIPGTLFRSYLSMRLIWAGSRDSSSNSNSDEEGAVPPTKKPCVNTHDRLRKQLIPYKKQHQDVPENVGKVKYMARIWCRLWCCILQTVRDIWKVAWTNRWSMDNKAFHQLEESCRNDESSCKKRWKLIKLQLKELASNDMLKTMFPDLSKLATIYLSILIATASVDRSFSQMKLIKTYVITK